MGNCMEKTNDCILSAMNADSFKKKTPNMDNLKDMVPDMDKLKEKFPDE